jgi:hypothetical protein
MNTNWIILLIGLGAGAFPSWWVTQTYYAGVISAEHEVQQQLVIKAQDDFKKKTAQYDKDKLYIAEAFEAYRNTHPVIRTKEVIKYVSTESDTRCIIPVGFVRLHNYAASGGSVSEADNGKQPNDSPAELALSSVGEVVAENYNRCLLEFEKIKALQETVRKFQTIH